jgi:hypothetical protein
MSSRELLELVDHMPDESEYKRALAGYPFGVERDWTKAEYRMARLVAEVAVGNNSLDLDDMVSPVEHAVVKMKADGQWPPAWWPEDWKADAVASTPTQQRNEDVPTEAYEAVHDLMLDQLYGRA